MECGGNGEDKKKTSFCFNFGDENIKLIDILSEDDDFLVLSNSPHDCFPDNIEGFEGFRFSSAVENGHEIRPHRPSFLRRSLAWDSAFLNSAGVLDHDELSFINKGFRTTDEAHLLPRTQDVRKRRTDSGSMNNGCGTSIDWFEIGPFGNTRSLQSRQNLQGLQNVQAIKKVDKSCKNKINSKENPNGKSINFGSEEKTRFQVISSPKPPKATINTSLRSRSNSKNLPGKSYVKMENRSSERTNSAGSRFSPVASTVSVPLLGKSINASSSQAASFLKRKTEPIKSELSGSVSNKQRLNIGLAKKKILGVPFLNNNDAKESIGLESNLYSPLMISREKQLISSSKQYCSHPVGTRSVGSLSMKNFRPSGLRPPSPNIRFFDENTPPSYREATTRRKKPEETLSEGTSMADSSISYAKYHSASKKLKTPCSEVAKNVKRSKTMHTTSNVKRPRDKLGLNPGSEIEKSKREIMNKRCKEESAKNLSCSVDQLGNLSKYFEAIDLNQESLSKLRKNPMEKNHGKPVYSLFKHEHEVVDSPSTRTPLTDRTSPCNLSVEFSIEPKKFES